MGKSRMKSRATLRYCRVGSGLHPRTGCPDFGVEFWGCRVMEWGVMRQSVTSGKWNGRKGIRGGVGIN